MNDSDPIRSVEVIELSIPFSDGGAGLGLTPGRWNRFDQALVRIETRSGLVGWGEAFAYVCRAPVVVAIRDMIAPIILGRDAGDPVALNDELQRRLHLFGRQGVVAFALSGVDIALWDIKAKRAGVPLWRLLGERRRADVEAYASLVRYGDPALVERFARKAAAEGYRSIKLHEIALPCIAAGRRGAGPAAQVTVDVNCAWTAREAREMRPRLVDLGVDWLEEPVFPPEDRAGLAGLRGGGVRIAAGENLCFATAFADMFAAGALDVAQPSVTKVGGVSEFLKVMEASARHGVPIMPHSPYFGPGYWATLHLAAVLPEEPLFEVLYVDPEAEFGLDRPKPAAGRLAPPEAPGLGFDPDPGSLRAYRV